MSIEVEDRTQEVNNEPALDMLVNRLKSGDLPTPSGSMSSTLEKYKNDNTVMWLIAMNESASRIMNKASAKMALFDLVLAGKVSISDVKDSLALLELASQT